MCCGLFQRDVSFPPLLLRGYAAEPLQDAIDEEGHDGGTDQARYGHSHKPGHEDVPEQPPVDCLPGAQPSNCNNRANLETKAGLRPGIH